MSLKDTFASLASVFGKVSASPTHLSRKTRRKSGFDVADLYDGPIDVRRTGGTPGEGEAGPALDEKLRQAYFWIINHAIISPFYDIEFNDEPPQGFTLGDRKSRLNLPTDQSYSSFVLLPLLTLVLRRRCLLVGGPGRGKTASAVLMGVMAGYTLKDIKRAIQHGQPQMTIADLLGNPLPSSLVNAQTMDDVKISWRKWLGMRVKIIDEYNRIPTRTQSALLTVLADDYAELYDQIYECPPSAWYLTANDDAGGGTYQVIEALRDRIDVVVKALHFNTRFLRDLLIRIEEEVRPEEVVPAGLVFSGEEIDRAHREILAVEIPPSLLRRIEFFTSHFEFCDIAADQIEYKTKDTVKLGGIDWQAMSGQDAGKDRIRDLGSQTRNGLSVRAMMTVLAYAKALAWFRGFDEVGFEDVRQIMPFVLHDKLVQDPDSPFFEQPGHTTFRIDRIGWIRKLFDLSCQEFDRLGLEKEDPVADLLLEIGKGLDGVGEAEVRKRLAVIERQLGEIAKGRKMYGHLFDDVLALKYMHQRYTNYLKWLSWKGGA
ncbi:MAG TPA: AAA family ATPase [Candidatus Ozemobacteraceae bacterium]|nr:AAA family ATPase [Candidatus Ozemobacteraceae bacterium]